MKIIKILERKFSLSLSLKYKLAAIASKTEEKKNKTNKIKEKLVQINSRIIY
jgi:hypothetical protein